MSFSYLVCNDLNGNSLHLVAVGDSTSYDPVEADGVVFREIVDIWLFERCSYS